MASSHHKAYAPHPSAPPQAAPPEPAQPHPFPTMVLLLMAQATIEIPAWLRYTPPP